MLGVVGLLSACTMSLGSVTGANQSGDPVVAVAGGNPANGPAAMRAYGCIACHAVPGVAGANSYVGPPLNAWLRRGYIAGRLPNEPDNLVLWIQHPQAVDPGVDMPELGVTESDARDIASYLYTLK